MWATPVIDGRKKIFSTVITPYKSNIMTTYNKEIRSVSIQIDLYDVHFIGYFSHGIKTFENIFELAMKFT